MSANGQPAYREYCDRATGLPIFLEPWWLDVTCGPDGWGAVTVRDGNRVTGLLPFRDQRSLGLRRLTQPPLTPFLGPWIPAVADSTPSARFASDMAALSVLSAALPPFASFAQSWSAKITNWLPFYWQGFTQTTRYTYVLENIGDEAALWTNLRGSCRREIRKALDRFEVTVETDAGIDEFLDLNRMVFIRQGLSPPYSEPLIRKIHAECAARGRQRCFIARDNKGHRHAGVYLVWDDESAYYLLGGEILI